MIFSDTQLSVIEAPLESSIFLSGPAGSGKTTAGIERLKFLLQSGVPGNEILLFFPQRNLATRYQHSLNSLGEIGFSLPVFASTTDDDIAYIANALKESIHILQ